MNRRTFLGFAVPAGHFSYYHLAMGMRSEVTRLDWEVRIFPWNRLDPAPLPHAGPDAPDAWVLCGETWEWATPSLLRPGAATVVAEADLSDRGVPSVSADWRQVGEEAARHLLDRGLRQFAVFAVPLTDPWLTERVAGFESAVARGGGRCLPRFDDPAVWPDGPPLPWDDASPVRRWLAGLPRPVGVFAPADTWGRLVVNAARQVGVRVPEDVAVVGAGDEEMECGLCEPRLSSVVMPHAAVGATAVRMTADLLAGRSVPARVRIPPGGVAARRSTDVLAVTDPDVAAALAFIRATADRPMTTADVLRHVPVYRRKLERHFRKTVGRSILHEIHRARVERSKTLLADSNLTVYEVARRCGYPTAGKLSAAFRKETGTTPAAYRATVRPRR